MAKARQVAGGGRAVEVAPDRLAGWFTRFAERNDGVRATLLGPREVRVTAGNGVTATATAGVRTAARDGGARGPGR
jgi:hypothetical protein